MVLIFPRASRVFLKSFNISKVPSWTLIKCLKGHHGIIYEISWKLFELDGEKCYHYVSSASADSTVRIWRMQNNNEKTFSLVKVNISHQCLKLWRRLKMVKCQVSLSNRRFSITLLLCTASSFIRPIHASWPPVALIEVFASGILNQTMPTCPRLRRGKSGVQRAARKKAVIWYLLIYW